MPRLTRIALVSTAVILLLVLAGTGILLWLVATEGGARLLAAQAQKQLAGMVEWQHLEGSLTGPMRLRDVRVSQPGVDIVLRDLELDWEPTALLRGLVKVDGISANGIRIALSAAEPTPPGEPFDPATLQLPVDIALNKVRIRDLLLLQDGEPVQAVEEIALDASLDANVLTVRNLDLRLPQGGLALTGTSALDNPMPLQLRASWDWRLPVPDQSGQVVDQPLSGELSLDGQLDWGEAIGFALGYRAGIEGLTPLMAELPPELQVAGDMKGLYAGESLSLEQLSANLDDTTLGLQGDVTLPPDGPPGFDLTLQWAAVQWPLAATAPDFASPSGELALSGTPEAYTLTVAATLAGEQIPESRWRGAGAGSLSQLTLTPLEGDVLGGKLKIGGTLSWDRAPQWDVQLQGSRLDPGQILPDYPGLLDIALESSGQLDPDSGLRAQFELGQLAGRLMDYPLNLNAAGSVAGELVQLDSLELESDGNRLRARGQVSPDFIALDWQLQAPAPGALLPGASGELAGSGTLAGSPEAPRLQAQLQGSNLALDTLRLNRLDATLEAGIKPEDKLLIELRTGTVENGEEIVLESLLLDATGTTAGHTLELTVDAGLAQVETRLRGGLDPEALSWLGELGDLGAEIDDYGSWRLLNPAGLSLAADRAALDSACLQHDRSTARLCLLADWGADTDSTLAAELQSLPMELLIPTITGDVSGTVKAGLSTAGALRAEAALDMAPGLVSVNLGSGNENLPHGGGRLEAVIGESGLVGEFRFDAPENGRVAATVTLPALNSLPLSTPQPLSGTLRAALPDLSSLAAWLPEVATTAGQLDADLQLAGSLEHPQLEGRIVLTEGAATIPLAGLQLQQIELLAVSKPDDPGVMELSGGMVSGPGRIDLSGQLYMRDASFDLALKGDRLQVYDTRDISAQLSPDLQLGWRDDLLTVRGQLTIPRADITPQLELSPATVAAENPEAVQATGQPIGPSPDVVVINAPEPETRESPELQAPFRIDSRIRLLLGDKVKVNSMGFISRVTGDVTFINKPEQDGLIPMARGRLSLEDGTFRAFGQDLDIEVGQLIFADVPATEPELNVRAVRWINNDPQVTAAGVLVTGSVEQPAVEMFSRRQLEPSEIQSYLLTGRSARDQESVLSIGTYLTPRFYVGYGYNLLEKTNEFNSLFSITPRYGVSANLGEFDNNVNMTVTYEH